jgi:hypothetical protein
MRSKPSPDAPLPRRAFLGLDAGGAPPPSARRSRGLYVWSVDRGGPAARAGVRAGDFLVTLNGETLQNAAHLVLRVSTFGNDEAARLGILREGKALELVAQTSPLPAERAMGGEVRLAHVHAEGHRLRTILTVPSGAGRHPAVLFLQGLGPGSCEFPLDPDQPIRRLVAGWTRAGFVTLRVDRPGAGDSEGPPWREAKLESVLAAYRAALVELGQQRFIAPNQIFLFGHSFGGMIAPLVAHAGEVRGVMTFGASARPWRDTILASIRRQLELGGWRGEPLERRMALETELHVLVCRKGMTPAEIFRQRPHLGALHSPAYDGEHVYGTRPALFSALDRTDLVSAFRALAARVLALHGEYDWASSEDDADAIVQAAGPERAERAILARIGHDMRAHDNLTESFEARDQGRWDGRVLRATSRWMRERLAERPRDRA